MNNIFPRAGFWNAWLKKAFSLLVSMKLYIINLSTVLLVCGKITSDNWTKVIITVSVAKIGIDVISAYKNKNERLKDVSED